MARSTAYCLIRDRPHYRRDAFVSGLEAVGLRVEVDRVVAPAGNVLVIWNRYGVNEQLADRFEREGGTVIVAENAYLGEGYAIALHAHNGRGTWFPKGPERFAALGVELAPERTNGRYVLIAPSRAFGMRGGVMPHNWAKDVRQELRRVNPDLEIRIRQHPGNDTPGVPLEEDLAGASRVVIWYSSVGVEALIAGIPVECRAPWWICKGKPRRRALEDMAWAQWRLEEIARGEPFAHLLSAARQGEVAGAA